MEAWSVNLGTFCSFRYSELSETMTGTILKTGYVTVLTLSTRYTPLEKLHEKVKKKNISIQKKNAIKFGKV